MPRLSLWRKDKTNDYKFIDRTIKEQFMVGGTSILIHKYIGPDPQGETGDPTQPNYQADDVFNETKIQDLLFLENRDRKYDKDIYDLRGVYNVGDNDFDLTQFGLFINTDVLFITFHLNDMIERLGRKIMAGDVFEVPHQRDDTLLDPNAPAINKWYVVQDASKAAEGYSQTWWPHLWRVKAAPLTDAQEYKDILGQAADPDSLKNQISTYVKEKEISDAIVEAATQEVPDLYPDVSTLFNYENPPDPDGPANANDFEQYYGAPIASGVIFPNNPQQGEMFIRTDFLPNRLFVYRGGRWARLYDNVFPTRTDVVARSVNAGGFINNDTQGVNIDGQAYPTRQPISGVVKPRTDF